jgi:MOSC domain-containing protein YiiM
MPLVLSVNVGSAMPTIHSDFPTTGIDKRPAAGAVRISDPGTPRGASGLEGDAIGDVRSHGGTDQAVYAYAREDLDEWERDLERSLPSGVFGENLTTRGLDVNAALVGERWRVGDGCVLEVTGPRIPCRTFAGWLALHGWERRFTQRGVPGAYLRVITPGQVSAGDAISVVRRPAHDVTIGFMFRTLTTEKRLIPALAAAGAALPADLRRELDV